MLVMAIKSSSIKLIKSSLFYDVYLYIFNRLDKFNAGVFAYQVNSLFIDQSYMQVNSIYHRNHVLHSLDDTRLYIGYTLELYQHLMLRLYKQCNSFYLLIVNS